MLDATRSFATCPNCCHAAHDNPCPECGSQISENGGLKKKLDVVKHRTLIAHYLEVRLKSDIEDVSFKNWSRDEVIDLFMDLDAGLSSRLDSVQNVATKNVERLAEVDPKDDHEMKNVPYITM